MKHLLFLLFILISTSCGTLKKRDNIVYADSTPRGVEVKDEKGKTIGTTPFFLEVDTFKSRNYTFKADESESTVRYGCPFDWGGSIVPNLIFIFAPAVSATFMLTDLLTGGAYVCKKPIKAELGNLKNPTKLKPRKKRIVILPIATRDKALSDKIIKLWKKKVFEKYRSDEIIIWNDKTESAFFVRGLDHYADTHPDKMRRRFLNEIGLQFDATHFLHITMVKNKKKKQIIVTPELYDAFDLSLKQAKFIKKFRIKDTEYDSYGLLAKIVDSLHILPNSIRGGFTSVSGERRLADQTQEYPVKRHPDQLNQLFTFIGLDSVHHPRFYDSWDLGGFLSPSLGASSFKSTQSLNDGSYEVLFESYYIDYNASLRLFTPFGQIAGGIGVGFMGFNFSDNRNLEYTSTTTYLHWMVDYTYFFGDRWFFKLAFDNYAPKKQKVHSDYYDLSSWAEASVRVGYYFPEIKSITRKLLPF